MKILFFCPRWGSENIQWDEFCQKVKNAGYDGIEAVIPFDETEKKEIINALDRSGLLLIGQYYQSFAKDFETNCLDFVRHMEHAASMNPLLIDSQTGKDFFTPDQNKELFRLAGEVTKRTGITIAHETHRNKALFAAHISAALLADNPDVRITADFSHWCNVSESLLEQFTEAVKIATERAIHIHARVGHSQSAQVSDPRAGEWKSELDAHLAWWDQIVDLRKKAGASILTITPEFGPPPYLPTLPYTGMPVANQWDINLFMMNLLKDRYLTRS